jgi:hypothetical protein
MAGAQSWRTSRPRPSAATSPGRPSPSTASTPRTTRAWSGSAWT